MKLTLTEADKQLTALLVGDIDHHTAKRLREEIDEKIEQMLPEVLVLDFGGVTFMDSSGIGLVMGALQRHAANWRQCKSDKHHCTY